MTAMKTRDFYFDLPDSLIAQNPSPERGKSRLLTLNRKDGCISHRYINDFPELIPENSVVVFNNSKVKKIRLFGEADQTGGKAEFFLIKELTDNSWECLLSKSKKQKPGKIFHFPDSLDCEILTDTSEGHRTVRFSRKIDDEYLERHGHIPLPPYIKREDNPDDVSRYQTIFAEAPGSLAAPTAGLHFTEDIISALRRKRADIAYVTLHVGLGTFLPVRSENIEDHKMHFEDYSITEETASVINKALRDKRAVVAVGTTSVRTLESSFSGGTVKPGFGSTNLFIYPGYRFKVVSHLLTNFHTPESSLLMLVSAFAGKNLIEKAYSEAINEKYRFFSYGDAMLIL